MNAYAEIKEAIKQSCLSQREAAKAVGLPYQNLSSALRGKRDIPLKESLLLDELLGFSPGHIHNLLALQKISKNKNLLKNTRYLQNRKAILEKIKKNGGFWSYDGIPENMNNDDLIEEALLHLDFEDFHLMFENWSESHIKRIWKKRLLTQGKRLNTLNLLLEILFFNNKQVTTEIKDKFHGAKTEILGDAQFLMFINDGSVKLSFFRPENPVKTFNRGYAMNNLKTPTLQELLGMKLYTLCVREKLRDYYDIYCLVNSGYKLKDAIDVDANKFDVEKLNDVDMSKYSKDYSENAFWKKFKGLTCLSIAFSRLIRLFCLFLLF